MDYQIDLPARKRFCRLMSQYAIGRSTSDEFDKAFENMITSDRTIDSIALETFAYDAEYRAAGSSGKIKLSHAERRQVARWILFLHRDGGIRSAGGLGALGCAASVLC